ncbi:hypothetical protein ACFTWF_15360 [Rhodococcus sp. NPDC056960]|uniref:hypothetical protein n=1 Tax=Rhodococcus sp. NPDC056960 TaxID=3345982 RepID=UPI00363CDA86
MGVTAVGACSLCCARPVLTALGGLSVLSAVGAVWVPALTVAAILAVLMLLAVVRRRRASTSCEVASSPVDLEMPTVGGGVNQRITAEPR